MKSYVNSIIILKQIVYSFTVAVNNILINNNINNNSIENHGCKFIKYIHIHGFKSANLPTIRSRFPL